MANQLKTFTGDNRLPIEELYASFLKLKKFGWIREIVHQQKRQGISLPILSLRTKKTGPAVWLIAGIHGEEPAGANALAQNIEFLGGLGEKGMPIVLLPLCNPIGYLKNWRYPNDYRRVKKGTSVGDSSHLLPDSKTLTSPRSKNPACPEAEALTTYVVRLSKKYPASLVIDFHEDEDKIQGDAYIYFQGELGANDFLAQKVVKILLKNGFRLQKKGIVSSVADSSLDELLGAKRIIWEGREVKGPSAERVVVVETKIRGVSLKMRIKTQAAILQHLEKFWQMVTAA